MREQSSTRWRSASSALLRLAVLLLVFSMSIDGKLFSSASGFLENAEINASISWWTREKAGVKMKMEDDFNRKLLVEQLAKVNPTQMSRDEKLAFWINIYNALIMHAYLAYGVPRSDVKHFSLMQKACYTVGGQCFSAVDIEFVILKMKPPVHRQQIALILALHKFKVSEEHKKFSIDCCEPLAFVCSQLWNVRIFTADNVQAELQKSMKDYIQASIGINDKGKVLVPQLLYCFAKGVVEDSLLVDWICRHLNPEQAAVVRGLTQRKRLLGVRSFSVIPFDSRFRYLFMPHNKNLSELKQSSKLEAHCG
ncbi:hypothetical protein HPP92_016711 [Vanilla planifolia]|uniref:DUF547 domain-containing protein n=1 Tax=Vanilla planifolia TaxID=51239 RepID=A0A835QFQ4_VANPL|nr:hypothetical protein HPP92_016711 [Vanilla planifolia]